MRYIIEVTKGCILDKPLTMDQLELNQIVSQAEIFNSSGNPVLFITDHPERNQNNEQMVIKK